MANPTAVCVKLSNSRQDGLNCRKEDMPVLRMLLKEVPAMFLSIHP